jgi:hypothetical protein
MRLDKPIIRTTSLTVTLKICYKWFNITYRSLIFMGVLKNPHTVSYRWWV